MGDELRRAVFLDRDGVLNETFNVGGTSVPPRSVKEFRLIEGVVGAVRRLRAAGYFVFVVTNQPDVSRGNQTRPVVEAIHQQLRIALDIDDIVTCFHDDGDFCDCRKPKPGMLNRMIDRYAIDPSHSFMVGDRWSDITAGRLAGCTTILVGPDWDASLEDPPNLRAPDLRQAVALIFQSQSHARRTPGA